MASVKLENLGKSFEGNWAVRDIGLEVEKGEMIVIVGPSGCGKSTLLRMIAGLEHSSTGRVSINGVDVNDKEPMDRNVAMVFQNYALYPHMSVYNNMAYGLKIARRPRQEIRQEVLKAAKLLQIEPYLKSKPRQLSGGQRQRVAMGRAIVRRPDLFLFDEPLSNLDAKLRLQMRMEIKLLQRRLGVTAFYVTHDQIEAMTLADRMLVMNEGICDQIGPPLEVYANPKTRFVAGFIGSPPTNFLSARLRGEDQLSEGDIGIRPEHIRLGESTAGIVRGRVHYIEPLGAETLVHLQMADGAHVTVRQENHAIIPAPDELVGLCWNEENEMLFDSKGLRIDRRSSSSSSSSQ